MTQKTKFPGFMGLTPQDINRYISENKFNPKRLSPTYQTFKGIKECEDRMAKIIPYELRQGLLSDPSFLDKVPAAGYSLVHFSREPVQAWFAHLSSSDDVTVIDGARIITYGHSRAEAKDYTDEKEGHDVIQKCEQYFQDKTFEWQYQHLNLMIGLAKSNRARHET